MYESPIHIFEHRIQYDSQKQYDEAIFTAVVRADIHVDRDELIKALKYDRGQYEKGFSDGKADAQQWISINSEEKPKHGKKYLCVCTLPDDPKHEWDWIAVLRWHMYGTNGYVDRPHFTDEGLNGMTVTHWMPLPLLPEGRRER